MQPGCFIEQQRMTGEVAMTSNLNSGPPCPSIPQLAGLCTFEEAERAHLSVEDCVSWTKRHHYVLIRLHEILTSRITAEPLYELKMAYSLHAHLCAEHASAFRQRVGEMREPPLGLETVPHDSLKLMFDEILCSPSHLEIIAAVYGVVVPELIASIEHYQATTNPLADAPTVRLNRFCLLELRDMLAFGQRASASLLNDKIQDRLAPWITLLKECLTSAAGISGRREDGATFPVPQPYLSSVPYQFDPVPKRDSRFHDSYNAGVNPEAFLYDERFAARDKVLMMFYKRLREIDVPEMMSSILTQTRGKPWKYTRDMTRQLWDEARHAMLGEVGFHSLGIDWTRIPINFTWSLNLNTQLEPWERHAVLFFIEQGLMPRTGKRYEWEVGQASGIPLAALIQDFDWADEVLHAQIGREWYVKEFADLNEAMGYGDRCWTKVLSHWREYLDQGLTEHRNWWPEIYESACQNWHIKPDPLALAFNTTYESIRADLADISMSG